MRASSIALAASLVAMTSACSASTYGIRPAVVGPGEQGYGAQTHSVVGFTRTDTHGISIAADAPPQGAINEVVWQAYAGGRRLRLCFSSPGGLACTDAQMPNGRDRVRGPILMIDPVNLARAIAVSAGPTQSVYAAGSLTMTNATYPARTHHGIWIVDGPRSLLYCRGDQAGVACHQATVNGAPVPPSTVLGMFQLGESDVVWVGSSLHIMRCVAHPAQPAPTCHVARGT